MVEGGGVELHEFHVGDGRAGAVGHGDAVAGGDVGIAGVEVDLAGTAGRQHGDRRPKGVDLAGLAVEHIDAEAAVGLDAAPGDLGFGDQIDGDMVFVDGDVRVGLDGLHQGPFDLLAGLVLGVVDAALAVAAFPGQVVGLVLFAGEVDAPVDQVFDGRRAVFDHHADDLFVGKPGAGFHGVPDMLIERVVRRWRLRRCRPGRGWWRSWRSRVW